VSVQRLTLLILFASLMGCEKGTTSDGASTAAAYAGVCQVTSAQQATVVCIDFPQNVASNQSSCVTNEMSRYAAQGASGAEYESVSGQGVSVSCQISNPDVTWASSCVLSDRIVRYSSSLWSGSGPADDCNSRSGTLAQSGGG
jgi:hypothetical protein